MWFSSIWPIDMTLSGATTSSQSGPESDGNKWVRCISQSSSVTGASPSDCLVSYLGLSLGESYLSIGMQLVYSAALTDWASNTSELTNCYNSFKKEITYQLFTYKLYLYPCQSVQTNDWLLIVTVVLQYLKPFNCL